MLLIIQLVHACTCPCCFTSVSDGFSFHGAKVRKKIDTRKREGDFFRHWRWRWHWLFPRGARKPYTSKDTGNDRSAQLLENLEILDRYATPERGK